MAVLSYIPASSATDPGIYAQKCMTRHRQPTKRNVQAIGIISSILFIGIYGLICYQIGAASRSADVQRNEKVDVSVAHKTAASKQTPIDESQLPYKCGVLFFYHIPSTGGSTINTWLLNYSPKKGGNVKYFTHWGSHHSIGDGEKVQKAFISGDDGGMNVFVKDFEPNEWRIAHCHHNSLHLNETEHFMNMWRSEVEAQGCHFVGNVMLRESLSHTLSLYKHLNRYNVSREEWADHLKTESKLGNWATQLDFFLYNNLARNPYAVSKQEKVRRALELLQRHFSIVTVGNHTEYKEVLLKTTGWDDIVMPRRNTHRGQLVFQKEEVEELHKLLDKNGDIDFIHEVKRIYGNQND